VTVTKTDGTQSTFTVKSGSKGSKGDKGDKGDPGVGVKGDPGEPGATGRRGNGILKVTTAPTAETSTVDGYSYKYKFLLSNVISESGASEVLVGDTIKYSYYEYGIGYVGTSYAFAYTRTSIRGASGTSVTVSSVSESTADGGDNVVTFSDGKSLTVKNGGKGSKGDPGYTPILGEDYWTDADKQTIVTQAATLVDVSGKLDKNQGASNVGKILVVGTDGNLVLADMPEGSASGDVVGVLDDANNILLTGALADGTYTLKYEFADGTVNEVGSIQVGAIPDPEEPDTPTYTNILTSGDYDIKLNQRWTKSGKAFNACNGMMTFHIPIADVWNKTLYFEGMAEIPVIPTNRVTFWCMIGADSTAICDMSSWSSTEPSWAHCNQVVKDGNGVYSVRIDSTSFPGYTTSVAYLVVQFGSDANGTAFTKLPDNWIMTINEPIV
jgi:hypothetical protein